MSALSESTKPVSNQHELIIEAGKSEKHYYLDLWRYRELLGFLAWRDIMVRYKQAALGIAWAVIQPVIQVALLTFVFGKLAGMPDGGVPYPLIVICGTLAWQFFATAFTGAGQSLVNNTNLISKVYFPRLVVPMAALGVALVDFGITLALAFPIILWLGPGLGWQLALLPLFVLLGLLISLGTGLWIAALTVRFRDFKFITPFLVQIGVFITPVGFRTDILPKWQNLLALNPLAGLVDGVRWSLLGGHTQLYLPGLWLSLITTAILLFSGLWYFRRVERQFADII
ncbi:phosphate ABC transporter permease [Cephaloticoccus primus]|uniref:Transport permease protein n=1 Tax=Cephaloticoccus primus TaxID=1548207 RepID=A0A139SPQ4_9BACT|nr:ABC transporter permease [Cephaloticoccus primus]KXU36558.1 phosphate ABC transporter permease [Cephaloticoccus primus]